MKRFVLSLALLTTTTLLQPAQAQSTQANPYLSGLITRTYNADDLKNRSALLQINVGEIWVLNLPDDVTDVITSKDGVLQFSQKGSKVIVGALASSGTYPILVTTADSVYFFTAQLGGTKGSGVHNVNVVAGTVQNTADEVTVAAPVAAPVVAPAAVTAFTSTRSNTSVQAQAAPATRSVPVTSPTAATTVSAPAVFAQPVTTMVPASTMANLPAPRTAVAAQTAPVAQASTSQAPAITQRPVAPGPVAPAYTLEYRALTNGAQTALYYQVVNTSTSPLMFDERALTLLGGNGKLPFVPSTTPVTVAAGQTAYGQIAVLSTPKSIQTYWSALGDAALVSRTVAVEGVTP